MDRMKVYLAGPITGLSFGAASDWRDDAKKMLEKASLGRVEGFSPLRSKDYLKSEGILMDTYETTILSSQRGIMTRDFYDCISCDLIFVNMLGAEKVSIGTVMEIAWGFAFRKPIVLCMEKLAEHFSSASGVRVPDGEKVQNIHEHAMLREAIGFRTDDFNQGIETVIKVLLP